MKQNRDNSSLLTSQQLDRMLQTMIDGMVMVDLEGQILYANRSAERILEIRKDELVGKYYSSREWRQIDGQGQPYPQDQLPLALVLRLQHDIGPIEHAIISPSGEIKWLSVNAAPLLNEEGKLYGAIAGFRDITEKKQSEEEIRKLNEELEERVRTRTLLLTSTNQALQNEIEERERAEQALRKSEEKYRSVAEFTHDWEYWLSPEKEYLYVSPSCERITGYKPEDFRNNPGLFEEIVHPADRSMVASHLMEANEQSESTPFDFRIITRDGEQRWIGHHCRVVFDANGVWLGQRGSNRDITERKQVEEALRLANSYNRSLIEASLDPLVTITPDGKVGDVNQATESATGCSREELIGDDFHSYFSEPAKARLGYQQVFEVGTVRDYELEIRHKDGHLTPVLYNASIFRDQTGEVSGVFAAARDITERKKAEYELTAAKELLENTLAHEQSLREQLVRTEKFSAMGRMLASISHELNNPLQTIKNCLYLTQQDIPSDSPIQEYLDMAFSETQRLSNLVAQLRELYRPHAAGGRQSVPLQQIIDDAHALLAPHLLSQHVVWKQNPGPEGLVIECVTDHIKQVFINLGMNAVEAMQPDGGTMTVELVRSADGDQAGVVFRDTGPGIPPENIQHLFEPFFTTKSGGLGLGLSICYELVQRYDGQITVESQIDQGTTITVWLPLERSANHVGD